MPYIINKESGQRNFVNKTELGQTGDGRMGGISSSQPTSMDSGQLTPLQIMLGTAAMKKGQYSAAWSILQPQKEAGGVELTGTSATDVNLMRNVMSAAQSASKTYDPSQTGLLNSLVSKASALLNLKGSEKGVSFRSDIADIRTAIRNYISGAAIPKHEAKEFEDLIPKVSESDTEVAAKLKKLQELSMRKVGNTLQTAGYNVSPEEYLQTEVTPVTNQPEQKNIGEIVAPNLTKMFGQVANYPQFIQAASKEAGQKGWLSKPSPELEQMVGGNAYDRTKQSQQAAFEVARPFMIASEVKNLVKNIGSAGGLNIRKNLGEKEIAAAKEAGKKTINTNKIINAGKDYVNSDPLAESTLKKVKPSIKNIGNAQDLLKRMNVWGKAYNKYQEVGKMPRAGLYNSLYQQGIEILKSEFPEVYRNRRLLGLTYEIPQKAGKLIWNVLKLSALKRLLTGSDTGGGGY